MNKRSTVNASAELRPGKTDWARIDALTDHDIAAAVAQDPDSFLLEPSERTPRRGAARAAE
jgi:hypothetical protein